MPALQHLPPLSVLAARLNHETPYRCICRNGGAEIVVDDAVLWFDETSAREVLSAVLFVSPSGGDGRMRNGGRRARFAR